MHSGEEKERFFVFVEKKNKKINNFFIADFIFVQQQNSEFSAKRTQSIDKRIKLSNLMIFGLVNLEAVNQHSHLQ